MHSGIRMLLAIVLLESQSLAQSNEPIEVSIVGIDESRLTAAIERELGRPIVVGAAAKLEIVVEGRSASVTYFDAHDDSHREIDLPNDADAVIETLALVAGNLARDQVSDLERRFIKPSLPIIPIARNSVERPTPVEPSLHVGRIGVYAMSGLGLSVRGAPIVPVVVGLAMRWPSAFIAVEGLTGTWGFPYGGADIAFELHRALGRIVLGAGVAAGFVSVMHPAGIAGPAHGEGLGIARGFGRASIALTRVVDLFAQLDVTYGHGVGDDGALMAYAGLQLRGFR